ncbi:MAG: 4Fe-4S binding protein [Thermoleophilia bacterium]
MDHHAGGQSDLFLLIPYLAAIILLTPVMIAWLWRRAARRTRDLAAQSAVTTDGGSAVAEDELRRHDLLRNRFVKKLLTHRAFQFAFQLPNAIVIALVVIAGIWGTQLGDKNFATVITWLIWWAVIIFTFLFLSRTWCMLCPLVSFAEWLQRGRLWKVGKRSFTLNRRWPKKLRNFWVPTVFFIILTWMYLVLGLATNPLYTALVTIGLFIAPAIIVSLIFERRTFCRYVCPIGGIIGVYSLTAPVELRNRDDAVCRSCHEKPCYHGNEKGYGCPVFERPQIMDTNTYCTMCTECIKTCPNDNIALNLRPFMSDLWKTRRLGFDVAMIVVILLGITVFQTLEMLEPWVDVTDAIMASTGLGEHAVLTISYLLLAVAAPILIYTPWAYLTRALGGKQAGIRMVFISFAFAFLPIALASHLAHNLVHFFEEGGVAISVISDPLGRGWDLLGTVNVVTGPLLGMDPLRILQMSLIALGYFGALYAGWRIARQNFGGGLRSLAGLAPMVVLMIAFASLNLWLLNLPMGMRE